MENETYERLIALLDEHKAQYRLIDHPAEGRTEIVSPMRGNRLEQAAKCMIVMAKLGRKTTKYILAVVAGNSRVDLSALKQLLGGTYASFASPEIAERLSGSVVGTVLPFSFTPEMELIVDPGLLSNQEIYFNAARLDRSMALRTDDYVAITRPRIERIASQMSQ